MVYDSSTAASWPQEDLTHVPRCPVCSSNDRKLEYDDLVDCVIGRAPGLWKLYRCRSCEAGWLDPRPSDESLPLAYQGYFTHDACDQFSPSSRRRWRDFVRNDYLNKRYGYHRSPATNAGSTLMYMLPPPLRLEWDYHARHLGQPFGDGRLLDVGCGNGKFLARASEAGWLVEGCDFDKDAISAASSAGLRVYHGGPEDIPLKESYYDVVTLSHVIEHVPNPIEFIQRCAALVKPGGLFWLATPNLDAPLRRVFGRYWRGLEAPRHLVLFNRHALFLLLSKAGLTEVRLLRRGWHVRGMLLGSKMSAQGGFPGNRILPSKHLSKMDWARLLWGEIKAWLAPHSGEELVIIARKPDDS